jgi:hypothetical protein
MIQLEMKVNHLITKNELLENLVNKKSNDLKEADLNNDDLILLLENCDHKIETLTHELEIEGFKR